MLELSVALLIFLFPLAFSPGPGNIVFAANGARFGFAQTVAANAGYHLATWVVTFAIGYGFYEIAANYPNFFRYVSYAGSVYVLYLAWCFARTRGAAGSADATPIGFYGGVVLLLINPKAYANIAAMFAQFLTLANDLWRIVWITSLFTLNNLLAFCLWAYLGDRLLYKFRAPENARRLNLLFALMLGGVGVWMLLRAR